MLPYFFFNDTATTEIYTLSLHDALPISRRSLAPRALPAQRLRAHGGRPPGARGAPPDRLLPRLRCVRSPAHRSEEHTSELQSRQYLVCRPLLEKKKL